MPLRVRNQPDNIRALVASSIADDFTQTTGRRFQCGYRAKIRSISCQAGVGSPDAVKHESAVGVLSGQGDGAEGRAEVIGSNLARRVAG